MVSVVVRYIGSGSRAIADLSYSILESALNLRGRKLPISEHNLSRIVVDTMTVLKQELGSKCSTNSFKLLALVIEHFGHIIIPTSEYLSSVLFNKLQEVLEVLGDAEFNYALFKALAELTKLCNCHNIIFLQWEKRLEPLLISNLKKTEFACYSFQLLGMLLDKCEATTPQHNVLCEYL